MYPAFPSRLSGLELCGWMRNLDDSGSRTYGLRHVDFGFIKVQPTIKNHGVVMHTGRNGIPVKIADITGDEIAWHNDKLEALLDCFLRSKKIRGTKIGGGGL